MKREVWWQIYINYQIVVKQNSIWVSLLQSYVEQRRNKSCDLGDVWVFKEWGRRRWFLQAQTWRMQLHASTISEDSERKFFRWERDAQRNKERAEEAEERETGRGERNMSVLIWIVRKLLSTSNGCRLTSANFQKYGPTYQRIARICIITTFKT